MCQKLAFLQTAPTPLLHRSYTAPTAPTKTQALRPSPCNVGGDLRMLLMPASTLFFCSGWPARPWMPRVQHCKTICGGGYFQRGRNFSSLEPSPTLQERGVGRTAEGASFSREASFFVPRAEVLGGRASSPQERMLSVAHFDPGWTCRGAADVPQANSSGSQNFM